MRRFFIFNLMRFGRLHPAHAGIVVHYIILAAKIAAVLAILRGIFWLIEGF